MPKADKRNAIIRASVTLFAEQGFYGTQVPLIAEQAKVGVGTIYRYFQDKAELVNAAFQFCQQQRMTTFNGLPDDGMPAREQFHAFWQRLVTLLRAAPDVMQFLEFHNHAPYLTAESLEMQRNARRPLRDFFARTRREQITKDVPEDVAVLVFQGMFSGLIKEFGAPLNGVDHTLPDALERMCWEALRR